MNKVDRLERGPFLTAREINPREFQRMFRKSEGTYRVTHFVTFSLSDTYVHEFNFNDKESWGGNGTLLQKNPVVVQKGAGESRVLVLQRK